MTKKLHLDDLPLEIHDLIFQHLADEEGYVLQIFPGGGQFAFPNTSSYSTGTKSRIRRNIRNLEDQEEMPGNTQDWWDTEKTWADTQRFEDFQTWMSNTSDLGDHLIPTMKIDSARLSNVGRHLKIADTTVEISTPGIPDIQTLTNLQQSLVESATTLSFRVTPMRFLSAKIPGLLKEFKKLKYIMAPAALIEADLPLEKWNSRLLWYGICLADRHAHEVILNSVKNLTPDWFRQETGNVSNPKASILMEFEIGLSEDESDFEPDRDSDKLLVTVARDISDRKEKAYILSVRWADSEHEFYHDGDQELWNRPRTEKRKYDRQRANFGRGASEPAIIARTSEAIGLPGRVSGSRVNFKVSRKMTREWLDWKNANIASRYNTEKTDIDFRRQDDRWDVDAITYEI